MSGERQEERGCRKGRDEERREGKMEGKRRECAREEHKKGIWKQDPIFT